MQHPLSCQLPGVAAQKGLADVRASHPRSPTGQPGARTAAQLSKPRRYHRESSKPVAR